MRVALICPCTNLVNQGARILSSYLKSQGHEVQLIFILIQKNRFGGSLSESALSQMANQVWGSGLIGLSFTTNLLGFARQITRHLKESFSIPIVWGGIHATSDPEACLDDTEIVCVGEGEETVLDLVLALDSKKDYAQIPNLWTKKKGQIYKNDVRPLSSDLDRFPDPDHDLSTQWILVDDQLVHLTSDLLKEHLMSMEGKSRYSVFTTRGCPHRCDYCCSSRLYQLYEKSFVRKRSLDRVFQELKSVITRFGFESICLQDENFLVRSVEEIQEFSQRYQDEIGLPFQCEFSPQTFQEEKLKPLIEAGLVSVQIGVQSINEETNRTLYHRHYTRNRINQIVSFFSPYQNQIACNLHFLTHNPWEKNESVLESIRYVADLPSWINVKLYPLIMFPGTPFYDQARNEGLIQNYTQDVVYKDWGVKRLTEGDPLILLFYWINLLRRMGESSKTVSIWADALLSPSIIERIFQNSEVKESLNKFLIGEYKARGWE